MGCLVALVKRNIVTVMLFEKNWEREARVYLFAIPKM